MILEALKRKHIEDDKLWEMVDRANKLTVGDYKSYDDNAAVLVPLMDRILVRAREKKDSRLYYYAMAKFFWLLGRVAINDIHRKFQISEMFHRNIYSWDVGTVSKFEGEWRASIAVRILDFYMDYPQVNDVKLEQMLEMFLDLEQRYGSDWNRGDYAMVMRLAALKRDKKLAETARKKISKGDFTLWCYTCYYIVPMLCYHVLYEDFESIEDLISSVARRMIPVKYQWCFEKCETSTEKSLVTTILRDCLKYGSTELFVKIYTRWRALYQETQEEELSTHEILFHVLAGDFGRDEEYLRIAEKDDQYKREHKESPMDSMYWALCWYAYFQILDRNGVKTVRLRLGEKGRDVGAGGEEDSSGDGDSSRAGDRNSDGKVMNKDGAKDEKKDRSEWTCLNAAAYFEHQANEIGAQMDGGRAWFHYEEVKNRYRECLLEEYCPQSICGCGLS